MTEHATQAQPSLWSSGASQCPLQGRTVATMLYRSETRSGSSSSSLSGRERRKLGKAKQTHVIADLRRQIGLLQKQCSDLQTQKDSLASIVVALQHTISASGHVLQPGSMTSSSSAAAFFDLVGDSDAEATHASTQTVISISPLQENRFYAIGDDGLPMPITSHAFHEEVNSVGSPRDSADAAAGEPLDSYSIPNCTKDVFDDEFDDKHSKEPMCASIGAPKSLQPAASSPAFQDTAVFDDEFDDKSAEDPLCASIGARNSPAASPVLAFHESDVLDDDSDDKYSKEPLCTSNGAPKSLQPAASSLLVSPSNSIENKISTALGPPSASSLDHQMVGQDSTASTHGGDSVIIGRVNDALAYVQLAAPRGLPPATLTGLLRHIEKFAVQDFYAIAIANGTKDIVLQTTMECFLHDAGFPT